MTNRGQVILRRAVPLLSGGLLLQASGCTADFNTLLQELVTAAATNLVASFVFGAFNLPLTGF